ncbi:MAG: hypothetical protein KC636_01045 [Myxococcales bacterium]|nr:hypothetical protein [Myxococcales bacterium]
MTERCRFRTPLLALTLAACVPQNLSRTVGRGNGELQVSVGGPFIDDLGVPAPVPHFNVGGRVGATDWLDVGANADLLAFAFGVWSVDVMTNFQLFRKPGSLAVASSLRIYTFGDLNDPPAFTALPEIGLHLGGPVPRVRWLQLYGGALGAFNFAPPPDRPPAFLTPFFGVEFLIPARWSKPERKPRQHGLALHWSWTNPWDTSPSIIGYRPGPGAMAIYLGYRLRFGGLDR